VCNFSKNLQQIPVHTGEQKILMASEQAIRVANGLVEMPKESVAVLKSLS
jgi:hypothetical protein